jgi:uracil-DNA glycosylase
MTNQSELNKIKSDILKNLKCPLKDAATNLVFGKGNPNAKLLFIGEAPGKKEDEQGIPFVGTAGKRLDKLLNSIGLSLDDVYIANILKYRPPKNRDPKPDEIKKHTPYLIKQIKTIQPKVVATLGNFSTKFMLGNCNIKDMKKIEGISKLHGKLQTVTFDGTEVTIIPLYHPAAMLYRPKLRETIEEDFQIIKQHI